MIMKSTRVWYAGNSGDATNCMNQQSESRGQWYSLSLSIRDVKAFASMDDECEKCIDGQIDLIITGELFCH